MATALNFPQENAEPIMAAINDGYAQLISSSAFCEAYTDIYEFAGCEWQVSHTDGYHHTIWKTKGQIDKEALTFAVLKGKIETS